LFEGDFKEPLTKKNALVETWKLTIKYQRYLAFISLFLGIISLIIRLFMDYGYHTENHIKFVKVLSTIIFWIIVVLIGLILLVNTCLPLLFIFILNPIDYCPNQKKINEYMELLKIEIGYQDLVTKAEEILPFQIKVLQKQELKIKRWTNYIGIMLEIGITNTMGFRKHILLSKISEKNGKWFISNSTIEEEIINDYQESFTSILFDKFQFKKYLDTNNWERKIMKSEVNNEVVYKFCLINENKFVIICDFKKESIDE